MNKSIISIVFVLCLVASSGFGNAIGALWQDDENPFLFGQKQSRQAPDAAYAPNELLVKFKSGTSDDTISAINTKNNIVSAEKLIKKSLKAADVAEKHGLDRIYLLKLQKNSDVNEAVDNYKKSPDVDYAEPNYVFKVDLDPNDQYFSYLWGMKKIHAPEAWDVTTGSSDIVVAVIDSGVDYNHADLAANMWINEAEYYGDAGVDDDNNGYIDDIRGWDFCTYGQQRDSDPMDATGHGTHCSGTIAGVGNNGIGVAGVSWNAKIMALKFLGSTGVGYTSDAIPAISYAINNGADIMSNSWGGGWYSTALKNAISAADDAGMLFIAAAGNDGLNTDLSPHYPSSYDLPNIISVAATTSSDGLAYFSNYGLESVDLAAPGVSIYSTVPGGYAWYEGTSMATPHVAGAAALIMAQYPDITHAALKAKILGAVDPLTSLEGKTVTGGRLNVFNSFDLNPQPELSVAATSPAKANQGSTFIVDAVVSNTGIETATGAEATITLPEGLSTEESLTKTIADISIGSPVSVSWTVDANNVGTYDISVTALATNADPAEGATSTEIVVPDPEPPTATLQYPEGDATVAEGNVVFGYIPDDAQSGILSCELIIDETTYAVDDTITEEAINEFPAWMSAGTYTWNVKCTDDSPDENEGYGIARTLVVEDQTHPANGLLAIIDVDGITDNTEPYMYVNASGADHMAFSCNNIEFSDWIAYCTVYVGFNINTGAGCTEGDGLKTVYVKFRDNAGNEGAYASDTTILDTTQPTISGTAASGITSMSATITWTTDEPADSEINYGTTTSLGSTTSDTTMASDHSITLAGLSTGTTYYYEVKSTDHIGHTTTDNNGGEYYTFETASVSPKTITLTPALATDTDGADVTAETQASDDNYATLDVRKGSGYVEMNFIADIPDGSVIDSVIFSYEHHETVYDAVYIEAWDGAGWVNYAGTIRASDTLDSEDMTAILDTELKAEDSTIRYVCQHNGGKPEKCYLDYAKLEITYTPLLPEEAKLSITVTSTDSDVNVGDSFTVDAVITNTGDESATGVVATIDLPAGLSTPENLVDIGTLPGGESTTASWLVNAETAGTYDLTATASATDVESVSDTTTVNVRNPGANKMHIFDIEMSTKKVVPYVQAVAKVTIVDETDAPVEGAIVYGTWSGLTSDEDFGATDENGQVSLESDGVKKPSGTYTFTVSAVSKDGWVYDPGSDVMNSGSITVP